MYLEILTTKRGAYWECLAAPQLAGRRYLTAAAESNGFNNMIQRHSTCNLSAVGQVLGF